MEANFPASYCRAGALWGHLDLHLAPDLTWRCLPLTDPWNVNNAKASDVRDSRTSVEHIPCDKGAFCNVRKVSGRGNYGRTSHCAGVVTFPSDSDRERVMTYRQRDRAGLRRRHAFADARSIRL